MKAKKLKKGQNPRFFEANLDLNQKTIITNKKYLQFSL